MIAGRDGAAETRGQITFAIEEEIEFCASIARWRLAVVASVTVAGVVIRVAARSVVRMIFLVCLVIAVKVLITVVGV